MPAQRNVFTPAKLGPMTLRNRIIKSATFEASTPNALVSDDLITYHRPRPTGPLLPSRTSTKSGGAPRQFRVYAN